MLRDLILGVVDLALVDDAGALGQLARQTLGNIGPANGLDVVQHRCRLNERLFFDFLLQIGQLEFPLLFLLEQTRRDHDAPDDEKFEDDPNEDEEEDGLGQEADV